MRLFFAVPVDAVVRAFASATIAELAAAHADCKWVEPENLHVTLSFLGEVPESRLSQAKSLLDQAPLPARFEMVFDRLGAFDSIARPKVIWLGVGSGSVELEAMTKALGGDEERPFHAHLTLGRVRGRENLSRLREKLKASRPPAVSCPAERVVLYRSRLSSRGPAYEPLAERRLS